MATEAKQPIENTVDSQNQPGEESHTVFALEGMTCASCAMRIEKGLKKLPGVKDANVNLATEQATVTYNPEQVGIEQMVQKVETVGYKAIPHAPPVHPVGASAELAERVSIPSQPTADLSASIARKRWEQTSPTVSNIRKNYYTKKGEHRHAEQKSRPQQ